MKYFAVLIFVSLLVSCASEGTVKDAGPALNPGSKDEGKNLSNPVQSSPQSIASGKKLFDKLCAECHGEKADGVSEVAAAMKEGEVKPPSLVDDVWDHGSTDGDIFVNIRDGVGGDGAMKGLNGRPGVGPNEMWNVVNYIRSLRPASAK